MASSSPADMDSKIEQLKDKLDTTLVAANTTVIAEDLDDILLDSYTS